MLRSVLNSSAKIISSFNKFGMEVITEITGSEMKIIPPDLTLRTEYNEIPESDNSQLSESKDPVINQLTELLKRKEFDILIKVAYQALGDVSLGKGEAYLKRLSKMEYIINEAKKTYYFLDSRLDNLHDKIIQQKSAILEGSIQVARAFRSL